MVFGARYLLFYKCSPQNFKTQKLVVLKGNVRAAPLPRAPPVEQRLAATSSWRLSRSASRGATPFIYISVAIMNRCLLKTPIYEFQII